jgi:hypothetical protein
VSGEATGYGGWLREVGIFTLCGPRKGVGLSDCATVLDLDQVEYVTDHAVENVENSPILEQLIDGTRVAPGPDCDYSGRIAGLNIRMTTPADMDSLLPCNATAVHEPL